MSMVINTNIQATRTHNVYSKNNDYMNQALTRVATGMKINSAKDGAANWAISEKMRERIRANDQANQNVQNDTALLKTAQGGIGNTIDILKTLKERALNSANDSNINTDRSAIAVEVQQLVKQIDDNATKVKFNGRTLLNGAADNTVGSLPGSTTTEEVEESPIIEPTVSNVNTPVGTNAVYRVASKTGFLDNSSGTPADATASSKLVDLVDSDGNALFKEGDLIRFNWSENGSAQQKTIEVTDTLDFTTLANELSDVGALKFSYETTNSNALIDAAGNDVKSSGAADASGGQAVKAEGEVDGSTVAMKGLYAVGDKETIISDLKVSVTYKDYDNEGKETTRVEGQKALEFTGIQQSREAASGSHVVYAMEGETTDAGNSNKPASGTTTLANLKVDIGGTATSTGIAAANTVKITIGTGTDAIEITTKDGTNGLTGASTLADIQTALDYANTGIKLVYAEADGELKDLDGNAVTKNTLDGPKNFTSEDGGLYFVNESGKDLGSIKLSALNGSTAINVFGSSATDGSYEFTKIQEYKATEETTDTTTTTDTASTAVTPLTFHVGGEAGFNFDISINKMTSDALFYEKDSDGNITKTYDDTTFAELFLTKGTAATDTTAATGAKLAIEIIDNAITTALNEQTKLGAIESRLGYTSDNITTMNENLEAADSAYRDSDIAKEMTNYMKYSVLAQASQYMLAQTSQNAFSVLNLLQA